MSKIFLTESATPDTPTSGTVVVYAKADGRIYFKDDTGQEHAFRERLNADRTYYVATTGSDSNDGLTVGAPFLTIQKAIDVVSSTLDVNGYTVTIQLADGTYAGANTLKAVIGVGSAAPGTVGSTSGAAKIKGNATTPANVIVTASGAACFGHVGQQGSSAWTLESMRLGTNLYGVYAHENSVTLIKDIDFGTGCQYALLATNAAKIRATGNLSISASIATFAQAQQGGVISVNGVTITATNTPAFSANFVNAVYNGVVVMAGNTYTGSATGTRYSATYNGGIRSDGTSGNFLGNSAGTTGTGGWVN